MRNPATLVRHDATGIERFEARWRSHRTQHHAHPEYQLTRTIAGRGLCHYRGGRFVLPPGCFALFHPAEPHVIEVAPDARLWHMRNLHLPAALLETEGPLLVQPGPVSADPPLAATLDRLFSALERDEGVERAASALGRALRALPGLQPEAKPRSQLVRICLDQLGAVRDRPVTLAELARRARAKPATVRRAFTAATGLPPHAWHVQRRIDEAKHLLARGGTVADVAAMTGFSDQAHLTRHFSRLVGVSPARYAAEAGARRIG